MTRSDLNSAIELHDSILASVESVGGRTKILLQSAYIHKSEGVPGVDPGTGWVQDVILSVESGSVEGQAVELPYDVSDGELLLNERKLENVVPLPLDHSGKIELMLHLTSNERLVIRGDRITSELAGTPRYVEDFPGTKSR